MKRLLEGLLICGVIFFGAVTVAGFWVQLKTYDGLTQRYSTMPARFEGQGALTLGCALWEVPEAYPDETVQPAQLWFKETSGKSVFGLVALVPAPRNKGMVQIYGAHCAMSVDWSAMPDRERAKP